MIIKGGPEGSSIRLWIATPCYEFRVEGRYVFSLLKTLPALSQFGVRFAWQMETDSLITRVRNCMVACMMAEPEQWTHLMFIDSDLSWEPEAILRLLDADHDVSCVGYPVKEKKTRFVIHLLPEDIGNLYFDERTGFLRIKEAGTGFLLIKREALECLCSEHPEMRCEFGFPMDEEQKRWSYGLFDSAIEPGTNRYLSEDYQFSRLWREVGGTVWLDPDSELRHYGGSCFAGKVANMLIPVNESNELQEV